jgi:hypothetical protein
MSVIKFEANDIGALAWAVQAKNNYRSAFELTRDKLESHFFKIDYAGEDKRIACFFDRLYIANQLAYFTTYQDDCAKDGSFTIKRLQEEDIGPNSKIRGNVPNTPRKLNLELRSLRYNIASNAGRTFFDEEDTQRLDQLIDYTANEIIEQTDPDRAVYEGD